MFEKLIQAIENLPREELTPERQHVLLLLLAAKGVLGESSAFLCRLAALLPVAGPAAVEEFMDDLGDVQWAQLVA